MHRQTLDLKNPYEVLQDLPEAPMLSPQASGPNDSEIEIKIEGASVITFDKKDPNVLKIQSNANVVIHSPQQQKNIIINSPHTSRSNSKDLNREISPIPNLSLNNNSLAQDKSENFEPLSPTENTSRSIFNQINSNVSITINNDDEEKDEEDFDYEKGEELPPTRWQKIKSATLKYAVKPVIGVVSGIVAGAYALPMLWHKQPEDIPKLWQTFSAWDKCKALTFGLSSFLINCVFPLYFFDDALEFITDDLFVFRGKTKLQILRNIYIASFGVVCGVIAGVVGSQAVSWFGAGDLSSIFIGLCSGVSAGTYFVSRTSGSRSGVNSVRRRMFKVYRENMNEIDETIDHLNHINKDHVSEINKIIKLAIKNYGEPNGKKERKFNNRVYEEIFNKVNEYYGKHPDLVNDTSTLESILTSLKKFASATLTLTILAPTFMTFAPKGFAGFEIFLNWFHQSASNLSKEAKIGIAAWSGKANVLLYANSSMKMLDYATDVIQKFWREKNILGFVVLGILTVLNLPAGSGMKTIAESNFLKDESNLFDVDPNSFFADYVSYAAELGGTMTNYVATLGMMDYLTEMLLNGFKYSCQKFSEWKSKPADPLTEPLNPEPHIKKKIKNTADIYTLMDSLKKIDVDHILLESYQKQKMKIQAMKDGNLEAKKEEIAKITDKSAMHYINKVNKEYRGVQKNRKAEASRSAEIARQRAEAEYLQRQTSSRNTPAFGV